MDVVYTYDGKPELIASGEIVDETTYIAPPDGLYEPISFDPDKQVWIGTSRKEWMDNLSNMQEENSENCK